ncbi:MAG: hypothetical protein Q8N39_02670 [Pelolinea sp.]|nr:hypothetical protein [Pelolinea sp.]
MAGLICNLSNKKTTSQKDIFKAIIVMGVSGCGKPLSPASWLNSRDGHSLKATATIHKSMCAKWPAAFH